MVDVIYTPNFYFAILLGVVGIFLFFLLVYLVFFKKPKKNDFDPKESSTKGKKNLKKDSKSGASKPPKNTYNRTPVFPRYPNKRPMPGIVSNDRIPKI